MNKLMIWDEAFPYVRIPAQGTIAWSKRKRKYEQHFISKLTDADAGVSETQVWLQFAFACDYISKAQNNPFIKQSEEVGRLIQYMIDNPGKFGTW